MSQLMLQICRILRQVKLDIAVVGVPIGEVSRNIREAHIVVVGLGIHGNTTITGRVEGVLPDEVLDDLRLNIRVHVDNKCFGTGIHSHVSFPFSRLANEKVLGQTPGKF